jgi:hypothetical protein
MNADCVLHREVQMNISKFLEDTILIPSILLLSMLVLAGCDGLESNVVESNTIEGMGEVGTNEPGIESTPETEVLTYTNEVYGFEFVYPGTWKLSEKDHSVVLKNGPNSLMIRYRSVDEEFDPYSGRTGLPAGDLIYEDKILFMDQVIPAEYLVFEKKYKAVFYDGTSWTEIDDLLFWIELVDLETGDYREIDLSDELIAEAKSIVESFKRIDRVDQSGLGSITSDSGFVARLEMPERLPVGENINLKFVLKNVSEIPLYILNWYTPLEGIGGEIFKVTRNGQAVPYEGILASRTPPTADAYTLLNPGESVSAVVDLSKSFDFYLTGEYRIEFISPRISHVARTEAEMASTMDELGPVNIPSNEVILELVESMHVEEYPRLRTPAEAQELIEAYLRDQGLDLGIEPIIPVEEQHIKNLWTALKAQVFKVSERKFLNESFLIRGSRVIQIGSALGGQGLTSQVVTDIDQNHQPELVYAYSYGTDNVQSRIGMFSLAYGEDFIYETDIGYFGQLGVFSEDESRVGVQVIDGDQDTVGYLFVEQFNENMVLGLKMHQLPPEEILEKLFTIQESSQD